MSTPDTEVLDTKMKDVPEPSLADTGQSLGSHVSETQVESEEYEGQIVHEPEMDTQEADELFNTQATEAHEENTQEVDTSMPDAQESDAQQSMNGRDELSQHIAHQTPDPEEEIDNSAGPMADVQQTIIQPQGSQDSPFHDDGHASPPKSSTGPVHRTNGPAQEPAQEDPDLDDNFEENKQFQEVDLSHNEAGGLLNPVGSAFPDLPDINSTSESDTDPETALPSFEGPSSAQFSVSGLEDNTLDFDPSTANQRNESPLFYPEPPTEASPVEATPLKISLRSETMEPAQTASSTANKPFKFGRIKEMRRNLQKKRSNQLKSMQPQAMPRCPANSLLQPAPGNRFNVDETLLEPDPSPLRHRPVLYDEKDKKARERFLEQKEYYDRLRKRGVWNMRYDLEWTRIKEEEDTRQRKRKRDRELELEELGAGSDPFFDASGPPIEDDYEEDGDGGDTTEPQQMAPRKRPKPNLPVKQAKHMDLMSAEYQAMMVQIEAEKDMQKANKKEKEASAAERRAARRAKAAKGKKGKGSAKSKQSDGSEPTSTKGKRKSQKQKREEAQKLAQTASLMTSNVWEDQAAEDAPEQPGFTSKNKANALKELLSSVSTETQKSAGADVKTLLAATQDFNGRGAVVADGGNWRVKGMKTSLKHYQVLGAAFMRRRENGGKEPRGGLMADQMGLGKTLMMLANIVNGRPPRNDPIKTTLIVASPSLLLQWEREIKDHTDCNFRIMRYGTGNRPETQSSHAHELFTSQDIILTTYGEMLRSYPDNKPPEIYQTSEEKAAWWRKKWETERGILHQIQFLRIVLDEAQAIKNYKGRTSLACRAAMATHRWALSGTPIMNNLMELYPYFRFLGVPHTGSYAIFKTNYGDPGNPENSERLLLRLNQFMIRRTHKDVMFGAPILKLPRAEQATHWCDFNPIERHIYNIVQQRFSQRVNSWIDNGTINKSYNNMMVMLLRLRQLTAHPLMLQFVMQDLLEREDIERIRTVVNESAEKCANYAHTIIAVREQLDEHEKTKTSRKKTPSFVDDDDDEADEDDELDKTESQEASTKPTQFDSGGGFGTQYDFTPILNSLTSGESWEKIRERSKCCACEAGPDGLWVTECGHLYCEDCSFQLQLSAAESDGDTHKAACFNCGTQFNWVRPCEDEEQPKGPETKSKKKQRKGSSREDDLKEDWFNLYGRSMLPSAKTIAFKAQVLTWLSENPDGKIIIYTQFLAMVRILAKICAEEDWPALQYTGKMSFGTRDKVLTEFAKPESQAKILLASLRCGGLGLNLTMANRVIMLDPWWNSAVEQQAFCRIFRIGQTELTYMTRFTVKDTVDERLMRMQERKQREIDEIMEDDGTRTKKIGIQDMLRLFGVVNEGDEELSGTKPYILIDNPDSRGGFHADENYEGYADDV